MALSGDSKQGGPCRRTTSGDGGYACESNRECMRASVCEHNPVGRMFSCAQRTRSHGKCRRVRAAEGVLARAYIPRPMARRKISGEKPSNGRRWQAISQKTVAKE